MRFPAPRGIFDPKMDWQRFDLPGMAAQKWIQLEILSTYPGTHYDDTALSALGFQ